MHRLPIEIDLFHHLSDLIDLKVGQCEQEVGLGLVNYRAGQRHLKDCFLHHCEYLIMTLTVLE